MAFLKRFLRALPLLLLSPLLMRLSALALVLTDLVWKLFGSTRPPLSDVRGSGAARRRGRAATVVIPNWNGKDLLEKYLPSVIAALASNPGNEILVVDNGSTDGSAAFVRERFPRVNVLALPENLGFGGGSNAGIRAARNDIVVLLNSDMRVAPDFLAPLVEGFADPGSFCGLLPDFLQRPQPRARRDRADARLVAGWQPARAPPHRWRHPGALPVLLWRRRLLRLRPRQIPRAGRLRPAAGALLPGRHRPGLPGLEARLEGALPAAQRGLARAPRHHRQALPRRRNPGRAEEELPALLLEEYPRIAAPGFAFRLHLGGRPAGGDLRRRSAAAQRGGPVARLPPVARRRALALARPLAGPCQRYGGLPAPAGRLFPRPFRRACPPRPSGCACCSFRPIPSARRCTAAASSCTRPCARWRGWRKCTWWACWTGPGRKKTTWSSANSAPRWNGWCARPAIPRAPHRCCRAPCANSATRISSG